MKPHEKTDNDAKTLLSAILLEFMQKSRPESKKKSKGIRRSKAETLRIKKKEKKEKKLRKIAAKSQKINRRR